MDVLLPQTAIDVSPFWAEHDLIQEQILKEPIPSKILFDLAQGKENR
jgi:hypothetical protein